ncbi:DUF6221 family protein [Streptomyces abikoensis]|uniref:DUF6221 family protein n=1 Tax=Streptomyces abikoensis TaxID=97398 RepID=A0ABW7TC49_9ACTN
MTTELVAFLRARLSEDERAARAVLGAPWVRRGHVASVHADDADSSRPHGTPVADCRRIPGGYEHGVALAEHIARHDPARVLAEVEARRAILDLYESPVQHGVVGQVLRLLSLPYAGHPNYREEWRP